MKYFLEEDTDHILVEKTLADHINHLNTLLKTASAQINTSIDSVADNRVKTELSKLSTELNKIIELLKTPKDKLTSDQKGLILSISGGSDKFKSNLKKLDNQLNQQTVNVDNVVQVINDLQSQLGMENSVSILQQAGLKKDWKALLDAANADADLQAEIWSDYFKTEWGDQAEQVKGLGQALIKEVIAYGFSEKTNPFIYFLKRHLSEFSINLSNYGTIHNAFVDGLITKEDLLGTGLLKQYNLLFCKDLYTKAILDISKLLRIQKAIKAKLASDKELKVPLLLLDANSAALSKYTSTDDSKAMFAYNFLYTTGNVLDPVVLPKELSNTDLIKTPSELEILYADCWEEDLQQDKKIAASEIFSDSRIQTWLKEPQRTTIRNFAAYCIDNIAGKQANTLYARYAIDPSKISYSSNLELKAVFWDLLHKFNINAQTLPSLLNTFLGVNKG